MLLTGCMVVFALGCASAPALALSQRGHTYAFSVGEPGTGNGQLSHPSSIAVDERTGELYISDAANNRIDQFQPQLSAQGTITGYSFKRAWGWGVADGEKRYETCETACKEGIKGGKFFDSPGQIAVDNSDDLSDPARGNVYVVANQIGETTKGHGGRVYEFGPEGEPVSTTEQHGPAGAPAGKPLPPGQPPMALGTIEEEVKPGKWKRNEELAEDEIAEELEVIEGVAVDQNGLVWLYGEDGEFRALTPHGTLTAYELSLPLPQLGVEKAPGRSGIAVRTLALGDSGSVSQDRLYARYEAEGEATEGKEPKHGFCAGHECLTAEIDAFNVAEDRQEQIPEEEEEQLISPALAGQPSTGTAVDPMDGDAYVSDSSAIAALDPSGSLIQTLGGPEPGFPGLTEAGAVAVDHAAGPEVGELYAVEGATDQIDVFAPAPSGPPAVDAISTREVSAQSAQLDAEIDPDGASTTYTVQYSTTPCAESPASCAAHFTCTAGPESCGQLPDPPASAGEAFGDQDVAVSLPGLAPSSIYHYRFLAVNPNGQAVSDTEGSFSTPSAKGKFIADQREWEMVSPPKKNGSVIDSLTEAGGVIQAAADGGAITYVAQAPIGETEGSRSFEATQMLSTRGPQGWSSRDIITPNEHGIGLGQRNGSEYRYFSEDLSLSLVQPYYTSRLAEPPLSPPLTPREEGAGPGEGQEHTIYLRDDSPVEPQQQAERAIYDEAQENGGKLDNPGYLALINDTNVLPGTEFGVPIKSEGVAIPALFFIGATPDLAHILIRSELAGETGCAPDRLGCTPGIYEWNAGQAQLSYISLLPDGEPLGVSARLGQYTQSVRHAISQDGTRIAFSSEEGGGVEHLYLRDTATAQTIQLDQVRGGSGEGLEDAEFQTASNDGSRVFFTDTRQLTSDSKASQARPDLYVCELAEDPQTHQLEECKLTDLTSAYETAGHHTESADVQGLALGASEDGSYIYFVAGGVLTETANAQHETPAPGGALCGRESDPQAGCNLYVEHYGGEPGNPGWPKHPTFIARLSNEDLPDWHYTPLGKEVNLTARVSPDGRYLAFMSDLELTGYDNVDSSPQAHGAHDEEVYLYEASSTQAGPGRLVCASCDPSGARPQGVYEPPEGTATAEGDGLLVDRPQLWAGRWLAGSIPGWTRLAFGEEAPHTLYQSRYLSSSGRLFFDSPADLVPEAINAKEDVYEYEPRGVPSGAHECTGSSSTFLAAAEGCLGLISSGTSTRESAFLDASETGGEGEHGETLTQGGADVFFLTAAPLSTQDTDTEFDVYDAHECTPASPCYIPPEAKAPPVCESTPTCHIYTPPSSTPLGAPASAGPGAAGNLTAKGAVLPSKSQAKPNPEALTRAQKLANALSACRAEHRRSKAKRQSCERLARRRYPPADPQKPRTKAAGAGPRHGTPTEATQ
jgi:hypothetical protein